MTEPTTPDQDEAAAAAAAAAAFRRAVRGNPRADTRRRRSQGARYADDRDPQSLGSAIDRLVAEEGWSERTAVAALIGDWAGVVGQALADHVRAVGFDDGVLTLEAESTTWATQVRLLLPHVHKAVDDRVGTGVVRRIVIQGPAAPSWTFGPRRVKGRGPRDTYG
jgi:predicted nucleic acid-binding Zn ribbon protein